MFKKKTPPYIKKIFFTEKQIKKRITCAAHWVDKTYRNKPILIIGILKGCMAFYGQLLTQVSINVETDFAVVSSFYGEFSRKTEPKIMVDIMSDVKGKDILLLDDVVDSGHCLYFFKEHLLKKGANSIKIISLINKPKFRTVDLDVDFSCFEIHEKSFLVGYGLDVKEYLRNLPYIADYDPNYTDPLLGGKKDE